MMYKISVPIMASSVTEATQETYLRLCREAGVQRVLLALGAASAEPSLAQKVRYFQSHGFEVGVWTDTVGHGVKLEHVAEEEANRFSHMVDLSGTPRPYTGCPLDKEFRAYATERMVLLAESGVDLILLDDDFRMSQHGEELCCLCPLHLARVEELLGERVTVEQLRPYLLSGTENRYRDAWQQAQREGLELLAEELRRAVDRVNPAVNIGLCCAPVLWNIDGTDPLRLSRLLAGQNHPLLRLSGAPYWATKSRRFPLVTVLEYARMMASFACGQGTELLCEGDVYPRPRYTCPGSYLQLYDWAMQADGGYDGILKYMFDYVAGPQLETGYLALHRDGLPLGEAVRRGFPHGANCGVRVLSFSHPYRTADLSLSSLNQRSPVPHDGTLLGSCGIPTLYRGKGVCCSLFGENARKAALSVAEEGLVLDAVSASILTQRGVDVGLEQAEPLAWKTVSFLSTADPTYKSFITNGRARFLPATLKPQAEPLLFDEATPVAYRYQNEAGQRFLVFLFEGDSLFSENGVSDSGLLRNYPVQQVLAETLPWVGRQPLPAYCVGNPELYLMCAEENGRLTVALWNCFADPVVNPTVTLGKEYRKLECVGCTATLQGNRVTLTSRLHGFDFAMFSVEE